MVITLENGGVTSPKGFKASGIHCGLKEKGVKDLALLFSEAGCTAKGVFTKNVVKGHSLDFTKNNINSGKTRAVFINSGNANACTGARGSSDALEIARYTAGKLKIGKGDVLLGSTGVIGKPLDMDAIKKGIDKAVGQLSSNGGKDAAEAIMTTDLVSKESAVKFESGKKTVTIGGMAKGSGMIHPNMATMIGIITTDANIDGKLLEKAFKTAVNKTFNRISVDGETSVCDMVIVLANGMAENEPINAMDKEYTDFQNALEFVCRTLSVMVAGDGEGATKLVRVDVENAKTPEDAYLTASSVCTSPLVKTTLFGEDANWGRIITAAGYSGASFNPDKVDIYIGSLMVCKDGAALDFDEAIAKKILEHKAITIKINLNGGTFCDRMWTCDFSYDYVKINGSYRS